MLPKCLRLHNRISNGHTAQNGTSATTLSFPNNSRSFAAFERDVVAQKALLVGSEVFTLCYEFFCRSFGDRSRRPDLAMRMRIACTHHRAAILKDLYVIDLFERAQFAKLLDPYVDYGFNFLRRHGREGEVMPREKQITRQIPGSPLATSNPRSSTSRRSLLVFGFRAA